MNIGYARVSTGEQTLDLQTDALNAVGCDKVFTDTCSGARFDRPGLESAIRYARPGDTLVIWRLDRLGRSLKDLITLVQDLEHAGIGLHSIQEKLDTTTATGKLIYHVFGALAEFERNLIVERTQAGLLAAKARGRKGGRPRSLNKKQIHEIKILLSDNQITVNDVAKRYGVSRGTIYNIKNITVT